MSECDILLVTSQAQVFLERLLNKLKIQNFVINMSQGSNKGDNFIGIITRANVECKDAKGNKMMHSFIVKSAPRNEIFRKLTLVDSLFTREIYMYRKVLHEFHVFQNEMNVKKPFGSYPKYYDSSIETLNEIIILEDMKEQGFELHTRQRLLNLDHTLCILKEYAKLHALSFAMRLHKPQLFKELAENAEEMIYSVIQKRSVPSSYWKQCSNVLLIIDPVREKTIYEKFQQFQSKMSDFIPNILKSDLTNPCGVIRHGDCWLNNFLFKYDTAEEPRKLLGVCILDWQLSHYGSPALDLSYLIFTCTEKKLRDEHYNSLIEEYYKAFSSFLTEIGGNPQKQFPFEILQEHLKRYSVLGLYMGLLSLLNLTSDTAEIPEARDMSRAGEFVEQFKSNSKNTEEYYRRIKGVILDMDRLGYDFY